ncbi:MAG: single-stranded DNA-binding protein [Desulfobacterales bacterium]|nr:single-stranded DNA-binding protein [Desulfobacterales bacterium]
MSLKTITDDLVSALDRLQFAPPVTHVYNPLRYARRPYDRYLRRYGQRPKRVILVGMNPGPWGMAQTGVPFGEISYVRDWMGICESVDKPSPEHPKRSVDGFACRRSEVSGRRLWGWAADTFGTPQAFFRHIFVANYCPLMFMETAGRNRTPDKLPAAEKRPLLAACDEALQRTLHHFEPGYVIGIGAFAAARVAAVSDGRFVSGQITHPSPANPRANRGWAGVVTAEFRQLGVPL